VIESLCRCGYLAFRTVSYYGQPCFPFVCGCRMRTTTRFWWFWCKNPLQKIDVNYQDMALPTRCYVDVHKGEVLYIKVSHIITENFVIRFNHTASHIGCALRVMLPAFPKNRTRIFIATALIAGFWTQSCQPSCSRDVDHHPDTYSLTMASGAVS